MIDAHHHLWDPALREYDWLMGGQEWATDEELGRLRRRSTLAELAPLAAGAGVTRTVVIQTVNDVWETNDLLGLAAGIGYNGSSITNSAGDGLLAGVVGWVDLTGPGVRDAVARLRAEDGGSFLCGIRHPLLNEADPTWLVSPHVLNGLRALGEERLCFDVVAFPYQLRAAVTAAQAVPELSFVLDHMGNPPVGSEAGATADGWTQAIRSLGALPNVTCKLSGTHGSSARADEIRPTVETVLEAFGPNRLMFGSDWPVSSLSAPYDEVCRMYQEATSDLSGAEQAAIFEYTACRVYGLIPSSGDAAPRARSGS